jgi:hypothetical protein
MDVSLNLKTTRGTDILAPSSYTFCSWRFCKTNPIFVRWLKELLMAPSPSRWPRLTRKDAGQIIPPTQSKSWRAENMASG